MRAFWIAIVSLAAGCAGARSHITAAELEYPVSLTGTLIDATGEDFEPDLERARHFEISWTSWSMLWTSVSLGGDVEDLSGGLAEQVEAHGGDAVVNLKVTVTDGWYGWFAALIPIIPSYASVEVEGDVVSTNERWKHVSE